MAKGKKKNTVKRSQEPVSNTVKRQSPKSSAPDLVLESGFWRKHWLPALLLFALAAGLYWQSVNFNYVLDDQIVLTKNQFVKKGFGGINDILFKETFQGYFGEQKNLIEGGRYRPLSLVTFALEQEFVGQNSKISHGINILLYALTALLLFRVMSMIFPLRANIREKWFLGLAFLSTLLFVAHPVHTEVVANVKGRDEILTLIGGLATLYFCLRYIATDKIYHIVFACISFFLGLWGKENCLTFLAVVPATIYCFTKASWKKNMIATLPLLLVAIGWLALRYNVIGFFLSSGKPVTDLMNNPFVEMNPSEKFATVFYTLGLYLKMLIYPHPLTHDYYPYHIPIMNWGNWQSVLSLLAYVGLGIYILWGLFKKHIIAYGVFFYMATLSMQSNVPFTVGTFMNERFIYVSSIGFCLILAYLLTRILPEKLSPLLKNSFGEKSQKIVQFAGVGIVAAFAIGFIVKTVLRVPAWESALSLNSAAIQYSGNSARANCFMGTALFEEYRVETDRSEKSRLLKDITFHVDKALDIHPQYGSALIMKSGIVAEHYKDDKDLDKLLSNFYDLLSKKRNLPFIEEYVEYLIDRADGQKLSNFCYKIGYEFFARKVNDSGYALKYLNYGMKADPSNARIHYGLGKIYEAKGHASKASQYLTKAYELDPSLPR